MKLGYRTITAVRELPPRMRIIYPEGSELSPTDRYLRGVDRLLDRAQSYAGRPSYGAPDLVSQVFANQITTHAANSLHSTFLIMERYHLADKHLNDIKWRLDELLARKPLRCAGPGGVEDGKLSEIERQILDLEKQKRQVQVALWRDVLELRQGLVQERREYRSTYQRMAYLSGGAYGEDGS